MAGRGSLAGLMPYGNANDVVLEMVSYRYGAYLILITILEMSFITITKVQGKALTYHLRLAKFCRSFRRHQC
jgi:hypothetical protein